MPAPATSLLDDPPLEVLLIGADASLADMYRLKLELDGYAVTGIARLKDLARQRRRQPDLVLIDIEDGEPERVADLERVRTDPALKDVPRIILASQRLDELRSRGITIPEGDNLICVPLPSHTADLAGYTVVDWRSAPFASA